MTKVIKHIRSGLSMSKISSFKDIENKHDVFSGKGYHKKICESLREHAIDFKKKKNEVINKWTAGKHIKMQKYVIFIKKT